MPSFHGMLNALPLGATQSSASPVATAALSPFAYETEADTLASSFAVAPRTSYKRTINKAVRRLKAGGVWPKLKALYVIGNDQQSSLINWITPGTYDLTVVGTPTFVPNSYWTTTATGQYLRATGLTADALSLNSLSHGNFVKTPAAIDSSDYGAIDADSVGISLTPKKASSGLPVLSAGGTFLTNTGGGDVGAYDGAGFTSVTRYVNTGVDLHRNGVFRGTTVQSAASLPAVEIWLLSLNNNGTAAANSTHEQQAWYLANTALTTTEIRLLYSVLADHLEALSYGMPFVEEAGIGTSTVSADFIAYGMTPQSILWALQAARAGKSVAICGGWRDRHYGGMSSGGLGNTDFDNKPSLGGLPRYIITRMNQIAGVADTNFHFLPARFRLVMRELLDPTKNGGYAIPIYLSEGIQSVTKSGQSITNFKTADGRTFAARQFSDGSYEGDFAKAAGVTMTLGREAAGTGNEALNGYRGITTTDAGDNHQFKVGTTLVYVDPFVSLGDPESGLLPGVHGIYTPNSPGDGSADRKLQGYNFRLTMTTDALRRVPLPATPPPSYSKARYELLLRYLGNNVSVTISDVLKIDRLGVENVFDVNAKNGFSTDLFGENHNYATATSAQREVIVKDHWNFILGLFYVLQHEADARVPSSIRSAALTYGFDNQHYLDPHPNDDIFAMPQLYVREAYRMVSDAILNGNDISLADGTTPRISTNTVAPISYARDSHSVQRLAYEYTPGSWTAWNEGNFEAANTDIDRTTPLPREVCVPKVTEVTNLSVTFAFSATHVAFGAARMEYTAAQAGQVMAEVQVVADNSAATVQAADYAKARSAFFARTRLSGENVPILPQVN